MTEVLHPSAHADATPAAEPERNTNVDVSTLLMLHGPHARIILWIFLLSQALLAFVGVSEAQPLALTVVAFVPFVIAAVWVVHPATDPLPAWWTAAVLLLCAVTVSVQTVRLDGTDWSLSATWHLGGVTTVLFLLILRGRVLMGWMGYLVMAAMTITWTSLLDVGPFVGVELVVRHAATLLVGTAIHFGLRGTARRITAINRASLVEAAADATARAAQDERFAQLARLDEIARPMLERVAQGQPLSEQEKHSCLLIEASLRDVVRGRGLAFAHVLAAARAARERGVEVTLLDDSDLPWGPVAVANLLAAELQSINAGTVTARLQPHGRDELASIVVAPIDGPARMLLIDLSGRVH